MQGITKLHLELLIADVQQQTLDPLTALNIQARPNYNNKKPRSAQLSAQSNQRPGNHKPFLDKFQWCNVKGHVLSQWRTFKQQHPSIPPPPRDLPQINTATTGPLQIDFLVDCGATHHITNDIANMAIHHPYTGPDSLFMGNNSSLNISHSRTLLIKYLSLSNVMCVPSMKHQIISVSQLTKQTNSAILFLPHFFMWRTYRLAKQLIKAHVSMDFIDGLPLHHLFTPFARTHPHHRTISLGTHDPLFSNLFPFIFP